MAVRTRGHEGNEEEDKCRQGKVSHWVSLIREDSHGTLQTLYDVINESIVTLENKHV